MKDLDRTLVPMMALGVLFMTACRKADESALGGGGPRPAAASASAAASAVTPAAVESVAPVVSADPPEVAWTDGGTWISSDIYDFKLESAKYCTKPQKSDAGEPKPGTVWLGVKAQILAKTDEVFLDRRHATLRDKGIYFQASLDLEPFGGCTPAFKPVQLKRGQVTSGYIVFELPKAWPNLLLEFQPTRWGGAGRVRAKVPDPGKVP